MVALVVVEPVRFLALLPEDLMAGSLEQRGRPCWEEQERMRQEGQQPVLTLAQAWFSGLVV